MVKKLLKEKESNAPRLTLIFNLENLFLNNKTN